MNHLAGSGRPGEQRSIQEPAMILLYAFMDAADWRRQDRNGYTSKRVVFQFSDPLLPDQIFEGFLQLRDRTLFALLSCLLRG